jgi:hypothetical protein
VREKSRTISQQVKEAVMSLEYIGLIIVAAMAVFIVTLVLFRGRDKELGASPTSERTSKVRECYDQCRQDPNQLVYSCAAMCAYPEG